MTRRGLTFLLLCASAFAQLPRSQAPMPSDSESEGKRKKSLEIDTTHNWARVDAVVTDLEGRPVPGLTAADFTLEANRKPRSIQSCDFHAAEPLRLVVILDDLSLNLDQSNSARRALRAFVDTLGPRDQMAVLRSSEGSGALDRLTSNKDDLQAAITRARFDPYSASASPESFAAGAVGVLRAVVEGMRELPGRKAVLLISTGVRSRVKAQFNRSANRASAVIYGADLGSAPNPAQLDEGVAALIKETGGILTDGDVARALNRIVADQAGYYVLTFYADDAGYDYISRAPRIERVALKSNRLQTAVRARDGLYGVGEDAEGDAYHEVEREFERAIDSDLLHDGLHLRVTPLLAIGGVWQIETAVHLDARDLTFVKTVDGRYRTSLDTSLALYDQSGEAVKETVRSLDANLSEKAYLGSQKDGFDYTVVLNVPKEGDYQARAVVRDARSGRIGSARRFVRAEGWQGGKMVMSSIVLRGEMDKDSNGVEVVRDPEEAASVRRFAPGHRLSYNFHLFNLGQNPEKASRITMTTEIWRDGVRVFGSEPRAVDFPPAEGSGVRSVTGVLQLGKDMAPGGYQFKIETTDLLVPRTVTQWMDFEVRP